MKENVISLKTQPEAAPGKVIAVPTSALQKLANSLAVCMSALATAESERRAAAAILAEVPPAPYDFAAAGRSVAQARVSDLLQNGSTADGVQQRLDLERAAAEAATAAYAKRKAAAQAQAERAVPMIAALHAQALELDRATRHELAKRGHEMEGPAAQALADAAVAYSTAMVEYRAALWLQISEVVGEHGKQFTTLVETDISIFVPNKHRDCLPEGWMPTPTDNFAHFDRYDLAGVVAARRRALMEDATAGVYPQAGAGLHRADLPRAAGETQSD